MESRSWHCRSRRPLERHVDERRAGLAHSHLAIEMLMSKTGTKFIHVPYKGAAPALLDLIGGRLDAYLLGLPGGTPQVKSGKGRLRSLTTLGRAGSAAGTPTLPGLGIPGYNFGLRGCFVTPAVTTA